MSKRTHQDGGLRIRRRCGSHLPGDARSLCLSALRGRGSCLRVRCKGGGPGVSSLLRVISPLVMSTSGLVESAAELAGKLLEGDIE